ncbi:MAG: hypothetical protein JRD93_21925 [Deltaproteobacteria bacterium]|nr:hypothetical protein [Deltaproteobacteria bacterium]
MQLFLIAARFFSGKIHKRENGAEQSDQRMFGKKTRYYRESGKEDKTKTF